MAAKVDPEVVKEKRNQNDTEILDVRTKEEVEEGMIPNAHHIPLDQVEEEMNQLDKDTEYITVCGSGKRADKAADLLNENGYQAKTLEGGMQAWDGEVTK
ncbi:rhodanese-like domain-containing protein [Halobacillus sp. BBL2006]|uniref:rhodanese-like domain-containing protein n=1 Tax=Halobacillus sp. BBL2006 TaxID=1543706 RepID=UPI000543A13B|nr:rhodanese-like domain-containing protein [Halobacillus sp. BBL2006]KHE72769.1 sulfurtransferase [Halobacillus sp. BBL2006]